MRVVDDRIPKGRWQGGGEVNQCAPAGGSVVCSEGVRDKPQSELMTTLKLVCVRITPMGSCFNGRQK